MQAQRLDDCQAGEVAGCLHPSVEVFLARVIGFDVRLYPHCHQGRLRLITALPPTPHKKRLNRLRSTIRARVEHVFGFQQNSMGGKLIRTIGLARAKTKIV